LASATDTKLPSDVRRTASVTAFGARYSVMPGSCQEDFNMKGERIIIPLRR